MFIVVGILSFLLAIIWYAVLRDRPEDSRWVSKEELAVIKAETMQGQATSHKDEGNSGITIGAMCKDGTLLSTYIGFFALGYIFWFALTWLPGYLQQAHHLTFSYSALLTSLPWIGYGIGSLAAGYLSDYSFKKTKSLNMKKHLIWLSLLLSGLLFIPAFLSNNLMLDVTFITLAITASRCGAPTFRDIVREMPYMKMEE
jgi:MFS transporter, ACS family, hexuronate transporter